MTDENWCLSGGADGADLAWGAAASACGHRVTHFSFSGARTSAPRDELVYLSPSLLVEADSHCAEANKALHRKYPPRSTTVQNLLRRSWYQVETAESVYAISTLVNGEVAGGTAWACRYFLDRHNSKPCACYVFDQEKCRWHQWRGLWEPIYEPPQPQSVWAGIGTRKLNSMGGLAIRVALDYWPQRKSVWLKNA